MKKNSILLLLVFLISCSSINRTVYDKNMDQEILKGSLNRSVFNADQFEEWFYSEYKNYVPNDKKLSNVKGELYNFDVKIVMGSWDEKSRLFVPRIYKILDFLKYHEPKIELIAVDSDFNSGIEKKENLKIKSLPVLIIYKKEKEVGRIKNFSGKSIEEKISEIITTYLN